MPTVTKSKAVDVRTLPGRHRVKSHETGKWTFMLFQLLPGVSFAIVAISIWLAVTWAQTLVQYAMVGRAYCEQSPIPQIGYRCELNDMACNLSPVSQALNSADAAIREHNLAKARACVPLI